ncbi:MAG: hypothetical protein AVDCRST_MAG20-1109 [uncultured Acidimicrobiales bacterium]|uniref:Uncharacterized protein n=1 Tax=uncultured Acidimicrobiales bacterium TaxID=310071 RepID=A0A6J4HR28_9ACTN|nr:MAG: hypothetical protein AVDCRST_MAG20-1109 [uncultured Acidimicrobiales bacterium]
MQVDRRPAWLLAGLLLVAACGGGGGDSDGEAATTTRAPDRTTSSTAPSTPPSTTVPPVDPSVIPDDPAAIDEAYVEAVLEEHNRVIGDALRLQLEGADLAEIIDRYNAIYVAEVADRLLTNIVALDDPATRTLRDPPGDQRSEVTDVQVATPGCISAVVLQDYREVLLAPEAPSKNLVVLRSIVPTAREALNPTAWRSEGLVPEEAVGTVGC